MNSSWGTCYCSLLFVSFSATQVGWSPHNLLATFHLKKACLHVWYKAATVDDQHLILLEANLLMGIWRQPASFKMEWSIWRAYSMFIPDDRSTSISSSFLCTSSSYTWTAPLSHLIRSLFRCLRWWDNGDKRSISILTVTGAWSDLLPVLASCSFSRTHTHHFEPIPGPYLEAINCWLILTIRVMKSGSGGVVFTEFHLIIMTEFFQQSVMRVGRTMVKRSIKVSWQNDITSWSISGNGGRNLIKGVQKVSFRAASSSLGYAHIDQTGFAVFEGVSEMFSVILIFNPHHSRLLCQIIAVPFSPLNLFIGRVSSQESKQAVLALTSPWLFILRSASYACSQCSWTITISEVVIKACRVGQLEAKPLIL